MEREHQQSNNVTALFSFFVLSGGYSANISFQQQATIKIPFNVLCNCISNQNKQHNTYPVQKKRYWDTISRTHRICVLTLAQWPIRWVRVSSTVSLRVSHPATSMQTQLSVSWMAHKQIHMLNSITTSIFTCCLLQPRFEQWPSRKTEIASDRRKTSPWRNDVTALTKRVFCCNELETVLSFYFITVIMSIYFGKTWKRFVTDQMGRFFKSKRQFYVCWKRL